MNSFCVENNLTSCDIVDLGKYGFISGATAQDELF